MAQFTMNAIQTVQPNQPVLLNGSNWGMKNLIFHRDESGIVTLRGIVNNPYANYALYSVIFKANIAVPEGGTPGGIAVAIAQNGEALPTSRAIVTPAAVDEYFNVVSTAFVIVPRGCCFDISVKNVSESATPATTPAPAINVQNAVLVVQRVG